MFRLYHLEAELLEAKMTLYRPHLQHMLVYPETSHGLRASVLQHCLQTISLLQRVRVTTPLTHVMNVPLTEA